MTEKVQFVVTSEGWHDSFEDVSRTLFSFSLKISSHSQINMSNRGLKRFNIWCTHVCKLFIFYSHSQDNFVKEIASLNFVSSVALLYSVHS